VLATVLFTDIVDSTGRASRLGDRRWRELLEVHDELARRLVEEFGGQLIKTTGDGMLATFDGPGRAIRCAAALRDELGSIGVQIRAGCTLARLSFATAMSAGSRPHRGSGDGGRSTRGHPGLQDRSRPGRGLRHHPA
jgi:hypothetical protein